ncbi:hypothetical protein BD414DRAFT_480767 [Trametes punicea]|nr:hypothetical protein BD414DRAFT_480767 [Trametes punicea]
MRVSSFPSAGRIHLLPRGDNRPPTMESPRLPTEVCEAILDTILLPISRSASLHYPYVATLPDVRDSILSRKTLCACALVCRAWRTHAQFLLWTYPMLDSQASLARFIATLQHNVGKQWASFVSMLHFHPGPGIYAPDADPGARQIELSVSDILLRCFPNIHTFYVSDLAWMTNPRLYRMRLPFLSSLTHPMLDRCIYDTFRDMLDLV